MNLMPAQKGLTHIVLILLASLGVITYLLISSSAPFKDKLFNSLYPKPSSHAASQAESVPDEILVKFKTGVDEKDKDNIRNEHGLQKLDEIKQIGVERVKVPSDKKDTILAALSRNPKVEFAEPNILAKLLDTPNDPYFLSATAGWNLYKIGAPAAWDISKGSSSVVVGVIDTGVYSEHEDLAGKIVPGYNFVNSTTDTSDQHGHGSAVSGVVGATTNNGKGIASLGREVSVVPLKVEAPDGSVSTFNIANAIIYGADHRVKVINMSLGSPSPSSTEQSAINYAWDKGVVLTAAAGNSNILGIEYPAAADNVIASGGTDSTDTRWAGSNYGPQLDVMAPGVGIYAPNLAGGYSGFGGTSFASPHVAALAALIFSINPSLTNQQVVDIITSTTDDLGDPGFDQYYGWGRINAYKALQKATGITPIPTPTPSPTPTPTPTSSDTTPPSVSITNPLNSSIVKANSKVNIQANASDNIGVTKVEFYVNSSLKCTDTLSPYSCTWSVPGKKNTSYTIKAISYDTSNNSTPASVTVKAQ